MFQQAFLKEYKKIRGEKGSKRIWEVSKYAMGFFFFQATFYLESHFLSSLFCLPTRTAGYSVTNERRKDCSTLHKIL